MTDHSAQHATFAIERRYQATPSTVFSAFADPARKRRWFVDGEGWTIDLFEMDFRAGGTETSRFRFKDGPSSGNDTVFHDIVENERIVMSYVMSNEEVPFSASLATIQLQPDGDGTRLVYTEQAVFLDGKDTAAQREEGWRWLLDVLGKEVEASSAPSD